MKASTFQKILNDHELTNLLSELIAIPSVNPYLNEEGIDEGRIVEFLFDKLKLYGFEVRLQEVRSKGNYYKFLPEKPDTKRHNLIARFGNSSGSGGKNLVLNGHLDTVSAVNMENPFNPSIDEKMRTLWGRGASDMKAGVAAMITAARAIMDSAEADITGTVILTLVVDEEVWGNGSATFVKSREEAVDCAIVCEPTNLNICLSQAGYLDLNIISKGESKHGSTIIVGEPSSAVVNTVRLCAKIANLPSLKEAWLHGGVKMRNTLNMAPIPSSTYSSYAWMNHEVCGMNILIGVAPRKSKEESDQALDAILVDITQLVDKSNSQGREQNRMEVNAKVHGFIQERSNPFVEAFDKAFRNKLTIRPTYSHQSSFCDGTFFYDAGIPTLYFGPGRMELGHSSREHIELSQVSQATQVYADAILRILG